MEVRIDVFNCSRELFCTAFYLMVARDNVSNQATKVPTLCFEFEKDPESWMLRCELGRRRQEKRKEDVKSSTFNQPPNSSEASELHCFLMNNDYSKLKDNYLSIAESKVEKTVLKHSQDRNIHGKIFGGLLMRESIELALVCAYKQGGGAMPRVFNVDDVHFILPVDVGSVVNYSATLNYTNGRMANVKVVVTKIVKEGHQM